MEIRYVLLVLEVLWAIVDGAGATLQCVYHRVGQKQHCGVWSGLQPCYMMYVAFRLI